MIWLYGSSLLMTVITALAIGFVRSDNDNSQTLSRRSIIIVWVAYLFHAGLVIWAAFLQEWPLSFSPVLVLLLGGGLALAGLALLIAAVWTFRSVQRMSGVQTNELIKTGIYGWSRNPQNVGWGLALLGIAIMGQSGYALLLTALFGIAVHAHIVWLEELYLEKIYGEEYVQFRQETKRYLGFSK